MLFFNIPTMYETTARMSRSMSQVLDLYDRLSNATDDGNRARIVADAFAELGQRYPHLPDLETRTHLSETEIKLTKEIEKLRHQTEQVHKEVLNIAQPKGL